MSAEPIVARLGAGSAAFEASDWDRCAGAGDPFVGHAFLSALEESGSAPSDRLAAGADRDRRPDGHPDAVMPACKEPQPGEYVFDHGWADAFERLWRLLSQAADRRSVHAGAGRRLLTRKSCAGAGPDRRRRVVASHGPSSAHATFIADEIPVRERGLADLHRQPVPLAQRAMPASTISCPSRRKRKMIRRARAGAGGWVAHFTGSEIEETHWTPSAFYRTRARGRPT